MPTDFPANTASSKQITPEVVWAQRSSSSEAEKNFIYLTISVPDVPTKDMKLDLKATGLNFTGHSESKGATYHVDMEFYAEIDTENSKVHHSQRDVEMKLQKKDLKEEYWPRLLKDSKRVHYLKTDFDKWVDEDEQDGVPDDDYMNQMGAGGGMPGMGGADGGFGGLDFSKLGGGAGMPDLGDMGAMGGMGGMGGMGEGDDDEGDDDEVDEDMPALEGDEDGVAKSENSPLAGSAAGASDEVDASTTKATGKAKIEEVE